MEFHEKYAAKGLNIMAISNEDRGTIEAYVKKNNMTYPVGVDKGKVVGRLYPTKGIPHAFLVGADGTVVWDGHPSSLTSEIVEQHLQNVRLFKLRDVVPALAEAKKSYEALSFGKSYKCAKAILDKKEVKEADAADAKYVMEEIDKVAAAAMETVAKLIERRAYYEAIQKLEEMAKRFDGTDYQKTALDKKKELEADKDIKRELDASKSLKGILDKIAAAKKNKEKKSYILTLEQFSARHKDTEAAKKAGSEIERLRALRD